jgi:hypothetical protein
MDTAAIILAFVALLCRVPAADRVPQKDAGRASGVGGGRARGAFDSGATLAAMGNKNPPPILSGDLHEFARFDKRYDWAEYDRVFALAKELAKHGDEAWPQMVEHLTDKRYCTTITVTFSESIRHNYSVGDVCREIMAGWLAAPYERHLDIRSGEGIWNEYSSRALERAYVALWQPEFALDNKRLKAWCDARRGKRLHELQIDACQWAAAEVPRISQLSDKEKAGLAAAIRADAESLRKSRKAIRFGGLSLETFMPFSPGDDERKKPAGTPPR